MPQFECQIIEGINILTMKITVILLLMWVLDGFDCVRTTFIWTDIFADKKTATGFIY